MKNLITPNDPAPTGSFWLAFNGRRDNQRHYIAQDLDQHQDQDQEKLQVLVQVQVKDQNQDQGQDQDDLDGQA